MSQLRVEHKSGNNIVHRCERDVTEWVELISHHLCQGGTTGVSTDGARAGAVQRHNQLIYAVMLVACPILFG